MRGAHTDYAESDLRINVQTCEWTMRALAALQSRLGIKIKMHRREGQLDEAQIFLFNHFARFETFIPQYIIHKETGAFCRSVASRQFFAQRNSFSKYLLSLGAVPNDHARLLPFLAEEILRGHKVVIFPEGGMVKDRRVIDTSGEYSIYSRSSKERRKHHAGAAVLALTLDAFKAGIQELYKGGHIDYIEKWVKRLNMDSVDTLMTAVRRPTIVFPSNITFYPIRVDENVLQRGAEFFVKGLKPQFTEELTIEGNLLFKDTDMDIRLGNPIDSGKSWSWSERKMMGMTLRHIDSIDELFRPGEQKQRWSDRFVYTCVREHINPMRDEYMKEMYAQATINLSHLAARLILMYIEEGRTEIDCRTFHRVLYLATKHLRNEPEIHLHRLLRNPDSYPGLLSGNSPALKQFFDSAAALHLAEKRDDIYRFLPKLLNEADFDQIRMENPIAVYANEMAPIQGVWDALNKARAEEPQATVQHMALHHFDDERRSHLWDRELFSKPRYRHINEQETAREDGSPYFLLPGEHEAAAHASKIPLGVVLVHGFLSSPAELKALSTKIHATGHPVLGVRLKGHGTSPCDLQTREWESWLSSVRRGVEIMSAFAERVCLVGFSTGGALSLLLASERPDNLAGVAVACTPLKYRNKNLAFVPLLHGANKLVGIIPASEGLYSFRPNESENPHINYRNIPIRGLYELRKMTSEMGKNLEKISCPILVLQSDADRVVDPQSAHILHGKLGSEQKSLHILRSDRHGILADNIGRSHELIIDFVRSLSLDNIRKISA